MATHLLYRSTARAPGEESGDSEVSDDDRPSTSFRRPGGRRVSIAVRPKMSVASFSPEPRVSTIYGPSRSAFEFITDESTEEEEFDDYKKALIIRIGGAVLTIFTILLIVAVVYLATSSSFVKNCNFRDSDYIKPRDLNNPEVFDDVTPEEYEKVNRFMLSHKILGLVAWEHATVNSSYILMIDLFLPNKNDVLQYLDNGSQKPLRRAKVIIVRGNHVPPVVEEYIVSPLPEPEIVILYRNPAYRREPIPYTSKPTDSVEYTFIFETIILNMTETMYPLLMESYGLCYHNCTKGKNCLNIFDVAPRGVKSGDRSSWFWVFPAVDGYYMHPLGLEFLINHMSTDVLKWHVEKIVYNGIEFDTVDMLMESYHSRTLRMIHSRKHDEVPVYSSYDIRDEARHDHIQGPKLIEPEGKRFFVQGQRVLYQKWEINYHMRPSSGMQLFNIKFDGTRIAYEISLQEVLVFYTGYGPAQSTTNYYDVSWFLGATEMELVRGVDCPETAVFLDSYFWANSGKVERFRNNICIFENNGAVPLRRHYANDFQRGFDFYGGIPDYHLVIRTIANLWNYDYVFDYIFHTNGAIEVKASATGYVQATYRLPEEGPRYGNPLHKHVMADLHQHVFNYKVDLDIAGERNRYSTLDIGLEKAAKHWHTEPPKSQMKITQNLVSRETNSSTTSLHLPQYHIIHNPDAKNQFGAERAYRILNKSPVVFVMADEPVAAAAKWAQSPVIVTQRKDTELDSTSIYAQNDPWDPVLDFADYIDDENLMDEDLVAWVTIGTTHIPGTEDIPSTPTTWNQYSFFLTPHNYFNECPSTHSADVTVIRPNSEANSKPIVQTSRRSSKSSCIQKSVGPFSFKGVRR